MQVLTTSGYKDPSTIANGDGLRAFDAATGAAIINTVENIDFVDYAEWCRWWQVEESVPSFNWIRINGTRLLFREQSIWRNGTNVCHARDLVIGDEIYNDSNQPVAVTSIDIIEDRSLVWYRFDVSGDHSYIVDGFTVHNASRFWVGGTGTWDSSSTTHWASSSGGSSGASVPGSADAVTLNGSSGGGTVTVNFGGTLTIQSIDGQAHTGTLDFSANNNSVTLGAGVNALIYGGSSTRTLNLGNGTWTITGNSASQTLWSILTTTNLTFNANSSEIVFSASATGSARQMASVGLTYNNISFTGSGNWQLSSGSNTFNTLKIGASVNLIISSGLTITVTTLTTTSTSSSPCAIRSSGNGLTETISCASGTQTISWAAIQDTTFSGGATFNATNSFDLGHNSGITITAPSTGGGTSGFGVIGG